jgi:hypothetical protein
MNGISINSVWGYQIWVRFPYVIEHFHTRSFSLRSTYDSSLTSQYSITSLWIFPYDSVFCKWVHFHESSFCTISSKVSFLIKTFLVLLNSGCWSHIGYQASSPQGIGMAESGCMSVSIHPVVKTLKKGLSCCVRGEHTCRILVLFIIWSHIQNHIKLKFIAVDALATKFLHD